MSEVIIDDCNVAECKYYTVIEDCDGIHDICGLYDEYCNTKKDCYFKQLQRAKAEKQEKVLKMAEAEIEIEKLQAENEKLHITIEKLKGDLYFIEDSLKDYQEHYNKLEAENEKLKAMAGVFSVRLMEKYKQALEEIREIGEKEIYMKQNASMNEIIRKINEVLND